MSGAVFFCIPQSIWEIGSEMQSGSAEYPQACVEARVIGPAGPETQR